MNPPPYTEGASTSGLGAVPDAPPSAIPDPAPRAVPDAIPNTASKELGDSISILQSILGVMLKSLPYEDTTKLAKQYLMRKAQIRKERDANLEALDVELRRMYKKVKADATSIFAAADGARWLLVKDGKHRWLKWGRMICEERGLGVETKRQIMKAGEKEVRASQEPERKLIQGQFEGALSRLNEE